MTAHDWAENGEHHRIDKMLSKAMQKQKNNTPAKSPNVGNRTAVLP